MRTTEQRMINALTKRYAELEALAANPWNWTIQEREDMRKEMAWLREAVYRYVDLLLEDSQPA